MIFVRARGGARGLRISSFTGELSLFEAAAGEAFTNRVSHSRRQLLAAAASAPRARRVPARGISRIRAGTLAIALIVSGTIGPVRSRRRGCGRKLRQTCDAEHDGNWTRRNDWDLDDQRRLHESKLRGFHAVLPRRDSRKFEFAGFVGPALPDFI